MKRTLAAISIVALAAVGVLAFQSAKPPADQVARFTPEGRLIRPKGWETWVMVGASTGLSYAKPATPAVAGASPGMFHNVYLQPWAYRYVMEHGAFPEGAMLVLSFFESSRKSNPARAGFYEGERIPGMEVHLKKADVDSTGWDSTASAIRPRAAPSSPAPSLATRVTRPKRRSTTPLSNSIRSSGLGSSRNPTVSCAARREWRGAGGGRLSPPPPPPQPPSLSPAPRSPAAAPGSVPPCAPPPAVSDSSRPSSPRP